MALNRDDRSLRKCADQSTELADPVQIAYDQHWVALVRLAALLTGGSPTAEDIVQEAFVRVFTRRRLKVSRAYLRAAVVNGCRDWHRHQAVVRKHDRPIHPDPHPGADDEVLRNFESQQVFHGLSQLPARQREVLVLRYYADYSEAEIAAALKISRGSVKVHASRALSALRGTMPDLAKIQGWTADRDDPEVTDD